MRTIHTRGRNVEIPECVDELTEEQYEYYIVLSYALAQERITPEYFRVRWMSYLIGLKEVDLTILRQEYVDELMGQMDALEAFLIREIIDGKECLRLNFETGRNLLPEYKGYSGPGDMLHGVSFGEFTECFTLLEGMASAPAEEIESGMRRIARVLYHIPESERVPEILAFHAPRFFGAVWGIIQRMPVEINGREIDLRIIFRSSGSKRADDRTGWEGIKFEVASAGLFGNVRDVEREDLWTVLLYLYKCKFEYLEEQKNQNKK